MKRDSSIEKFTNNKIATSPTESDIMYRYKYKYLNNYQTENLSFETKKLIEKCDSKNDSNENLKYKNFNQLSNTVFHIVLDFTLSWILAKIQDNVMDSINLK